MTVLFHQKSVSKRHNVTSTKGTRKCSICKHIGHTKKNCSADTDPVSTVVYNNNVRKCTKNTFLTRQKLTAEAYSEMQHRNTLQNDEIENDIVTNKNNLTEEKMDYLAANLEENESPNENINVLIDDDRSLYEIQLLPEVKTRSGIHEAPNIPSKKKFKIDPLNLPKPNMNQLEVLLLFFNVRMGHDFRPSYRKSLFL